MIRIFVFVSLLFISFFAHAEETKKPKKQTLLLLKPSVVTGVDPEIAKLLESTVVTEFTPFFAVSNSSDLARMLSVEQQKQLAGCDKESSCMYEIAGALGSEYVVATQFGKVGQSFVVSMSMHAADKPDAIARVSEQFKYTNDESLIPNIQRASQLLIVQSKLIEDPDFNKDPNRNIRWAGIGLGASTAITGVVVETMALLMYNDTNCTIKPTGAGFFERSLKSNSEISACSQYKSAQDYQTGYEKRAVIGGILIPVGVAISLASAFLIE